jgi:hypothetical protein
LVDADAASGGQLPALAGADGLALCIQYPANGASYEKQPAPESSIPLPQ